MAAGIGALTKSERGSHGRAGWNGRGRGVLRRLSVFVPEVGWFGGKWGWR